MILLIVEMLIAGFIIGFITALIVVWKWKAIVEKITNKLCFWRRWSWFKK